MSRIVLMMIAISFVGAGNVMAIRPVERQDIGSRNGDRDVLIVSEWSRYKERLIEALVAELDDGNTAIEVRNFDDFRGLQADRYDAVVVINAGVGSEVRSPVVDWLNRQSNDENIVVLTTQITDWTPQITVDSVTTASQNRNVPDVSKELAERVRGKY